MPDNRSKWPKKFLDESTSDDTPEIVDVIFEDWPEEMAYVKFETGMAIGLVKSEIGGAEDIYWIPKGQVEGDIPEVGEWIDTIRIPRWLADKKELDYESLEG